MDIKGFPALVVEPYSPHDDERANPAFIRLVVGDHELHISGGDSLSSLIDIPRSMIVDPSAVSPSGAP